MPDETKSKTEKLEKLDELLRAVGTAMFTTADEDTGRLHSRPMALRGGLDGECLYFFSYLGSEKLDDVKQDRHVNCAFAHPGKKHFVSVSGRAFTTTDRAKMDEKWDATMKAWFPQGLDTDGICLIRVGVDDAQYWDAPNQTLIHLYGMAKAAITGEGVKDAGENEKVTLK